MEFQREKAEKKEKVTLYCPLSYPSHYRTRKGRIIEDSVPIKSGAYSK